VQTIGIYDSFSSTLREIRHEESFFSACNGIRLSCMRLDEIMLSVEMFLAIRPGQPPCEKIPGTMLSAIMTTKLPNAPALKIFFTFNDWQVQLRHVELAGVEPALAATAAES
jgi:hypothetical protein